MPLMIVEGDLFESDAQILVNAVNCNGVMGKGIAKRFRLLYPDMYTAYRKHCKGPGLLPGDLWIWGNPDPIPLPQFIFNVATKDHWQGDSKWPWIAEGLGRIMVSARMLGRKTIAMPALGCGEGGLNWVMVRGNIQRYMHLELQRGDLDVFLYKPHDRG